MKTMRTLLVALGVAVTLGGCQSDQSKGLPTRGELETMLAKTHSDNQALLDSFNSAAVRFYHETADAYFILGYEYYKLAKAEDQLGKKEQADSFARMAMIYGDQQKDLEMMAAKRKEALSPAARAALDAELPKMAESATPALATPALTPTAETQTPVATEKKSEESVKSTAKSETTMKKESTAKAKTTTKSKSSSTGESKSTAEKSSVKKTTVAKSSTPSSKVVAAKSTTAKHAAKTPDSHPVAEEGTATSHPVLQASAKKL